MDKFKLIAFAIVAVFALALAGGFVVLEATGRPTATFIVFGSGILGNLAIFGGLGYAQVKQSEKLDTIKTQTNGTLSALREDNAMLQRTLLEQHGVEVELTAKPPAAG